MVAMRLCVLFLCLLLGSASNVERLNTVDLRNVRPSLCHGLQLLLWFAQLVREIDQDGILTLDSKCNPKRGDFGFHYFENEDEILPILSEEGKEYYSVANPNTTEYPQAYELLNYIKRFKKICSSWQKDKHRLVISMHPNQPRKVYNAYITAHYYNKDGIRSSTTYEIDPALIQQIRNSKRCNVANNFCNYYFSPQKTKPTICYEFDDENRMIPTIIKGFEAKMQLYTKKGKACARLYIKKTYCKWLDDFSSSWVGFYNSSENPNEQYNTYSYTRHFTKISGHGKKCYDVYEYQSNSQIAPGVQIRFFLNNAYTSGLSQTTPWKAAEEWIKSLSDCKNINPDRPKFWSDRKYIYGLDANRVPPIKIKGIKARMQLYSENGKACARIYIEKTFKNCQDDLTVSWVGFYNSSQNPSEKYNTYQYVKQFAKLEGHSIKCYDIYEFCSSLPIAHGVQIRFFFKSELTQTIPWQTAEEWMTSSECVSSDQEHIYGPETDDANGVIPIKVKEFGARLQLFSKDGVAYARVYIEKTFSNWQDVFTETWVGFYNNMQDPNEKYVTYEYVKNIPKVEGHSTACYDIYEHSSNLPIVPGVQIRIFLTNAYTSELVRTTPWKPAEKATTSPSDCKHLNPDRPDVWSYWPDREYYYGPEFDDANRVVPAKIKGFEASLQLYDKDGKACARLYIKNTFRLWQDDFRSAWVAFYNLFQNPIGRYDQYVVNFKKVIGHDIKDYDIYEYEADLPIAPGVQISFFLNNSYNSELARTAPWEVI